MQLNRVKQLIAEDKPAFGTYVSLATPQVVELVAMAGFDYMRIDTYHKPLNLETTYALVTAAYSHGLMTWVRCRNDPWVIMLALDSGAQGIQLSNIQSAEAARAAVAATFYPPKGEREASRPLRYSDVPSDQYVDWATNEIMLACQIEGKEGLENYREIIAVEGIDVIQTGRNDISYALGLPGQQFHPSVLEAERRIVLTALEAGKQVALVYPATDEGMERIVRWHKEGVRIFTVEQDAMVLLRAYKQALGKLREAI
jgi:2-keto-3-deoxy-L-rhamnonate aldolase RhmA